MDQWSRLEEKKDTVLFSIIIPVWPDDERPLGLDYIDKLGWPKQQIEVILTRGFSPCKQRNEAAKIAKGDILIFLDEEK